MTAAEWLQANDKHPFEWDGLWLWGVSDPDDPSDDAETDLPPYLFERMTGDQLRLLACRGYRTLEAAMADFEQAFEKVKEDVL